VRLAALLLAGLAAGCAGGEPPCPAGTQRATVAEAYFGRDVRGRAPVTDAEWRDFLDGTMTPAFPDGLTAVEGAGQWRGTDGRILREASKVVTLVLPGATAEQARERIRPLELVWTSRFQQDSVLTVYRSACVGF
jgi:hypothetical protein